MERVPNGGAGLSEGNVGGEGVHRCHSGHCGSATDPFPPADLECAQQLLQEDPDEEPAAEPGGLPEGHLPLRPGAAAGVRLHRGSEGAHCTGNSCKHCWLLAESSASKGWR